MLTKKLKALFSSTSEVYADSITLNRIKVPTKELSTISIINLNSPRSSYFLSKVYGESMIHYSKFHILYSTSYLWGKNGNVPCYAELMKKCISIMMAKLRFSPSHTRAFCYIDDAVKQIELLITSQKSINKTFNIGNPSEEIKLRFILYHKRVVGSKCKLILKFK